MIRIIWTAWLAPVALAAAACSCVAGELAVCGVEQSCPALPSVNGTSCVPLPEGLAALSSAHRGQRRRVTEELAEKLSRIPVVEAGQHATTIDVPVEDARFIRLMIHKTDGNTQPCIDELEVFGPDGKENLALAERGAVANASSVLPGHAIHAVKHLNDGLYGNDHSWIAASPSRQWVQVELSKPAKVARVIISRDRQGRYRDRHPKVVEVLLSMDGKNWQSAATWDWAASAKLPRKRNPLCKYDLVPYLPVHRLAEKTWDGVLDYAFLREKEAWSRLPADDHLSPLVTDRPALPGGKPYWGRIARLGALQRVLVLFEEMIERLAEKGLNVTKERRQLADLQRQAANESAEVYLSARRAKRRLFFRDPDLASLERVLFVKRHPFLESHNYSEHLDSFFEPGGGIFVLHVPRDDEDRLEPALAEVEQLFDGSEGIARDPTADFDAQTIYFAYRPDRPMVDGWGSYWHLYAMAADGSGLRRLTDGPFHDFDPAALPDGGVAFITTRCKVRFLCWRPQAYVLYRMDRDGANMTRLSFANLSEWTPSIMRDGCILWTRSEYLDKGADFGHTLWSIRPDGTSPRLVFGNNTPNCYGQAHEVPGTREFVCTLISHGGHQGPIALIDRDRAPFDTQAITNITPDTRPHYQMSRPYHRSFRDPYPISRDHFLVAHNPDDQNNWGIYVIDRYGNRELLYVDPEISSKRPTVLRPRPRPPVTASAIDPALAQRGLGVFTVQDVYAGLGPGVPRGRAKYLQVAEEIPPSLEELPCGRFRDDHPPFMDFYASPVHRVTGPAQSYTTSTKNAPLSPLKTGIDWPRYVTQKQEGRFTVTERSGWPSYVAKASLGTVRIADDGSASFLAPAGRVLYFQVLDEKFNEIQRMRSVIQLQPGERRSCVGCHEDRHSAPLPGELQALSGQPQQLEPPPWGAVPFSYEKVVQPVWDRNCVRCHRGGNQNAKPDLRGIRDAERVPASYRSLIAGGWVHFFDLAYGMRHFKAEPLSFGTVQSRLWKTLEDKNHRDIALSESELRAVKAWIDLNCPLWPDYRYRLDRPGSESAESHSAR